MAVSILFISLWSVVLIMPLCLGCPVSCLLVVHLLPGSRMCVVNAYHQLPEPREYYSKSKTCLRFPVVFSHCGILSASHDYLMRIIYTCIWHFAGTSTKQKPLALTIALQEAVICVVNSSDYMWMRGVWSIALNCSESEDSADFKKHLDTHISIVLQNRWYACYGLVWRLFFPFFTVLFQIIYVCFGPFLLLMTQYRIFCWSNFSSDCFSSTLCNFSVNIVSVVFGELHMWYWLH